MNHVLSVEMFFIAVVATSLFSIAETIPLPEHPRPDFQRKEWTNLNGTWQFRFDKNNQGEKERWFTQETDYPLSIQVPFGWGSNLSGVKNEADIGWYRKTVRIPETWKGKRVFLVVGASDWETRGWFDGMEVGMHQGGYTPFSFELTHMIQWGKDQTLALRVDDMKRCFTLTGKQGYGNVRGIWQTAYLEARPDTFLDTVHFSPDIDKGEVGVHVTLSAPAKSPLTFSLAFKPEDHKSPVSVSFAPGQAEQSFRVPLKNVKLWDLEHPYLYEVRATLAGKSGNDELSTYFGMRKVSVTNLPGTSFPYVALNNKPCYLRLTLDQSYTPDGYYTFPSDEYMKNEILISKRLGLSGNRIHIKIEVPRKLYWADKLGLLIMADVPNSWGTPTQEMFRESEYALRNMIKRDMNHPSIFCWVLFNETWGLLNDLKKEGKHRCYLPQTQDRVAEMYRLAKQLDSTRLIEDQSPCNLDHVVSDLNSWHCYRPGYNWENVLKDAEKNTFPGSTWNYINGFRQGNAPMLNSECGNVWGYKGSAGDVDWSWDYHMMIDAFQRHPKCCGWLYTEHHDVCNEWNGYVRFDRTEKFTGMDELFPGMSMKDFHSDVYLALDTELCRAFKPGDTRKIPLTLSLMTDRYAGKEMTLKTVIRAWDTFGRLTETPVGETRFATKAWQQTQLPDAIVRLPSLPSVGIIGFTLSDGATVLSRNFTTFVTRDGETPRAQLEEGKRIIRIAPKAFAEAKWSEKQWSIFDGLKVNGAGKGFFAYEIPWPAGLSVENVKKVRFLAEISAKRLNGKDRTNAKTNKGEDLDYMRGAGLHDPSKNPNAYPMTDTVCWKGAVRIVANGETAATVALPDDPADHRGILSWFAQKRDATLHEAGSYGYLVDTVLPASAVVKAAQSGKLLLRLESDGNGLALYGEQFGRFPMDLTLVVETK